jgi:hypothetical protein
MEEGGQTESLVQPFRSIRYEKSNVSLLFGRHTVRVEDAISTAQVIMVFSLSGYRGSHVCLEVVFQLEGRWMYFDKFWKEICVAGDHLKFLLLKFLL